MVFILQFVNVMYHSDLYMYIDESLHPWDKSWCMIKYPFNLKSIQWEKSAPALMPGPLLFHSLLGDSLIVILSYRHSFNSEIRVSVMSDNQNTPHPTALLFSYPPVWIHCSWGIGQNPLLSTFPLLLPSLPLSSRAAVKWGILTG